MESSKVNLAILLSSIRLFLNLKLLTLQGNKINIMTQKPVKARGDLRNFVKRRTACLLRNSMKRKENEGLFKAAAFVWGVVRFGGFLSLSPKFPIKPKRPFMKKLKFRKCRKTGGNFSKQREHDKFLGFFPFPIVPSNQTKKKVPL